MILFSIKFVQPSGQVAFMGMRAPSAAACLRCFRSKKLHKPFSKISVEAV